MNTEEIRFLDLKDFNPKDCEMIGDWGWAEKPNKVITFERCGVTVGLGLLWLRNGKVSRGIIIRPGEHLLTTDG